jgi:hypothetical protein
MVDDHLGDPLVLLDHIDGHGAAGFSSSCP